MFYINMFIEATLKPKFGQITPPAVRMNRVEFSINLSRGFRIILMLKMKSNLILRKINLIKPPEPLSFEGAMEKEEEEEARTTTTGGAVGGWTEEETRSRGVNSLFLLAYLLIPHSPSPILYHSSPCFLHLSVWHVQTAATIQLVFNASVVPLSLSLSLPPSLFPVVCLLNSFIPLSQTFFSSLAHSCLIYVIPCISFFFNLVPYSSSSSQTPPPPTPPLCQLSFLDMFVICDGPLPSFHCCLFPLHTALFSAAVQIQARTGHN